MHAAAAAAAVGLLGTCEMLLILRLIVCIHVCSARLGSARRGAKYIFFSQKNEHICVIDAADMLSFS